MKSGLRSARRKLALLRLVFLEGVNRYRTIFQQTPPIRVLLFSERVTFYLNGASPKGWGTTAYAWFVWDQDAAPASPQLVWLKPGYKQRRGAIRLP